MTRRPKVWEPRAESVVEEMPLWWVVYVIAGTEISHTTIRAPHAWDAWLQVKGAPAFGSCHMRRCLP